MSCLTQFETGYNGPTGLPYERLRFVARMQGVKVTPKIFESIQVLENIYLRCLSAQASTNIEPTR
jgi:hypothetical protein